MTDTTTTPEAELEQLEQDAIDGKPVTGSQLAEARAKIDLVGFVKKGKEKRAAAAAAREADEARETAKAAAVGKIKGQPAKLLAAYDAAVDAMNALYEAREAYQAQIQEIGVEYRRAGVVSRVIGQQGMPENYDPRFHAYWEQGGIVGSVTVDGVSHASDRVDRWMRIAAHTSLNAHRETQTLASKLGTDSKPRPLAERGQ